MVKAMNLYLAQWEVDVICGLDLRETIFLPCSKKFIFEGKSEEFSIFLGFFKRPLPRLWQVKVTIIRKTQCFSTQFF